MIYDQKICFCFFLMYLDVVTAVEHVEMEKKPIIPEV